MIKKLKTFYLLLIILIFNFYLLTFSAPVAAQTPCSQVPTSSWRGVTTYDVCGSESCSSGVWTISCHSSVNSSCAGNYTDGACSTTGTTSTSPPPSATCSVSVSSKSLQYRNIDGNNVTILSDDQSIVSTVASSINYTLQASSSCTIKHYFNLGYWNPDTQRWVKTNETGQLTANNTTFSIDSGVKAYSAGFRASACNSLGCDSDMSWLHFFYMKVDPQNPIRSDQYGHITGKIVVPQYTEILGPQVPGSVPPVYQRPEYYLLVGTDASIAANHAPDSREVKMGVDWENITGSPNWTITMKINTQIPFDLLEHGKTYYFRLRHHGNGTDAYIPGNSFIYTNPPPSVQASLITPHQGDTTTNFKIGVLGFDFNNDPITYSWDFGTTNYTCIEPASNCNTFICTANCNSTPAKTTIRYNADGNYTVKVTLTGGPTFSVFTFPNPVTVSSPPPPITGGEIIDQQQINTSSGSGGTYYFAQTFTQGVTGRLTRAAVYIAEILGTVTSDLAVDIVTVNPTNGQPTTQVVGSEVVIPKANIKPGYMLAVFPTTGQPSLTAGTKYAIRVRYNPIPTVNTTGLNRYALASSSDDTAYVNGTGYYGADGSSWTAYNKDWTFLTYVISDSNIPPTVSSCNFSPATAVINSATSFTLNGTAADTDGTISSWHWHWGDATDLTAASNPATQPHTFTAVGTYTPKLHVADNKGGSSTHINCNPISITLPQTVSGTPVLMISYHDRTNSKLKLAKSTDNGVNWSTVLAGTASWGVLSSISAIDQNKVFISYSDLNQGIKFIKSQDGATSWWNPSAVSNGIPGAGRGLYTLDANTILLSFYDYTTGPNLKFAKSTNGGTSWSKTSIDSTQYTGDQSSISALDANNIFVSYYDHPGKDLKFAKSSDGGVSWTTSVVDNSAELGWSPSIKAADANTIFISYHDHTNSKLKFAKSTNGGTNWTISAVDSTGTTTDRESYFTSLDTTDANNIFISYYDFTNKDLKFAKSTNGGTNWTISAVDSTGEVGYYSTIRSLDTSNIYISYYDFTNRDLKFAKSSDGGVSWTKTTLDSVGGVGGWPSINALLPDSASVPVAAPTPAPSPTPTPTPASVPGVAGCTDGTIDQVYTNPLMAGCDGAVTFDNAANLCGTGSHVCSLPEYLNYGGNNTAGSFRWLSTKSANAAVNCSNLSCVGITSGCWVDKAGNSLGLMASGSQSGLGESCTTAQIGHFGFGAVTNLFGAMCCTQPAASPTPTPTPTPAPSATATPTPIGFSAPPPTGNPCTLTSASWSVAGWATRVNEGTSVGLTVQSSGDCSGRQVSFDIREDDGIFGADPVRINPPAASFIGNSATSTWAAEYQCDGVGCINDPPEYYFEAKIAGETTTIRSQTPQVEVVQSGVPTGSYAISGSVFVDSNNNGVRDSGEVCFVGSVRVNISLTGVQPITYTQDANCSPGYKFDNLPAGTYTINIDPITGHDSSSATPWTQTITVP